MKLLRRWPSLSMLLITLALAARPAGGQEGRKPDVIYVPTEQAVVDEMLRMAQLSKDSVVYDLGCGDGRIVISAANHYGARGVGIDIDPERIRESRQNARAMGVWNRVKFMQADLFKADIHEATAVMLYLSSAINVRLRPMLLRQLKPGTPIVSHDYLMGDWQPDESSFVNGAAILLWIVPARVAGVWHWTVETGVSSDHYQLTLQQEFQKVTGTLMVNGKEEAISSLNLSGDRLEFQSGQSRFSGQVAGGKMNGLLSAGTQDLTWTATRDPQTEGAPME